MSILAYTQALHDVLRADRAAIAAQGTPEAGATARERGYKPKWVGVQFQNRFGHWPAWPLPKTERAA